METVKKKPEISRSFGGGQGDEGKNTGIFGVDTCHVHLLKHNECLMPKHMLTKAMDLDDNDVALEAQELWRI